MITKRELLRKSKMRIGKVLLLMEFLMFFVQPVFADMQVNGLTQLNSKRVSRYLREFEYIVNITNEGPSAEKISVSVTSSLAPTTIVNGNITFANLSAGESGASTNTLVIRHDLRIPYDPSSLSYAFSFDDVTAIDNNNNGFTPNTGDCNEHNTAINPDSQDIADNGIDDGYEDEDYDNADLVTPPGESDQDDFTEDEGDCDHNNSEINPDATDTPNNGTDENFGGVDIRLTPVFLVKIISPKS